MYIITTNARFKSLAFVVIVYKNEGVNPAFYFLKNAILRKSYLKTVVKPRTHIK